MAVRSAVVPGLLELPLARSFLSNSARLFFPLAVSNPPSSSTVFASADTSRAFSLLTLRAMKVSGRSERIFRKVWTTAVLRGLLSSCFIR